MAGVEIFDDPLFILIDEMGRLGLENTSGVRRYYSLYLGVVVINDDPGKQGMVKVIVRATGQKKALPLFARPSSPFAGPDYGMYMPPEVGDVGWVSFDHGDPTARPRYMGSIWRNPKKNGNASSSHVPEEFKNEGAPKVRGFKSPGGSGWRVSDQVTDPFLELWTGTQVAPGAAAIQNHVLRMSDFPGQQRITLKTGLGTGQKLSMIDLPLSDAGIFLESVFGLKVELRDQDQTIELRTPAGLSVSADDQNQILKMETPSGHIISMDEVASRFFLSTLGDMEITAQQKLLMQVGTTFNLSVIGASTWTLGALTVTATAISLLALGAGVVVTAGVVLLGLGAVAGLRLVTEAFLGIYNSNVAIQNANVATFNAHAHPFINAVGAPSFTAISLTPMFPVAATPVSSPNITETLKGN